MVKEDSSSDAKAARDLLNELEQILEFDPLIDEVGFIHPSQIEMLNKEAVSASRKSQDGTFSFENLDVSVSFWSGEHKLGISSEVLFPLYKAAKHAFMEALMRCKTLEKLMTETENMPAGFVHSHDGLESEVMKHSRALLLLSCDFGTAWNSRKLLVSKKHHISAFMDELHFSALVLSYSPKSEQAWSHRRWVIRMIAGKCATLPEIIRKESELVEKLAERSKMNYRAWNHRHWLVSHMTREQVLQELKKSRDWAGLHVADNCCFNYRRQLMLRILEDFCDNQENESSVYDVETHLVWKEELDWNEVLIKRYIGREALWLHRRFLSVYWIRHFATDLHGVSCQSQHKNATNDDIDTFIDNELHLLNFCTTVPDHDFDDNQAQLRYCATYILWLTKHIPRSQGTKLSTLNLKSLLNKACPERSTLWDCLMDLIH